MKGMPSTRRSFLQLSGLGIMGGLFPSTTKAAIPNTTGYKIKDIRTYL